MLLSPKIKSSCVSEMSHIGEEEKIIDVYICVNDMRCKRLGERERLSMRAPPPGRLDSARCGRGLERGLGLGLGSWVLDLGSWWRATAQLDSFCTKLSSSFCHSIREKTACNFI